eukprot:10705703-Karenia_brevis.AAC.1
MGLHGRVLHPLSGMYRSLKRRFRMAGGVGQAFVANNGILQGCAISVILVNALMSVWAKAVETE